MKTVTVSGIHRHLAFLAAALVTLTGCAGMGKPKALAQASTPAANTQPPPTHVVTTVRAESIPPGRTHGMPSVSASPSPQWYAERFGRARGIGEAIRRNHVTVWDKDTNGYGYYVGGTLYARYVPFEHRLQIHSVGQDPEIHCLWNAASQLAATPADGEAACNQLLDELDAHVARTGDFPAVGLQTRTE